MHELLIEMLLKSNIGYLTIRSAANEGNIIGNGDGNAKQCLNITTRF